MKRKAIICDIDLVLLDSWEPILIKENAMGRMSDKEAWDLYYNNLDKCKRNEWCYTLIEQLSKDSGIKILFVTGREERARKDTKAFLNFKTPVDWDLYMRETGCLEPDHDVKRKIIKELMEDYDIMFAIDDRINNCKVYQECGIVPLHVIVNDPRFPV